MLFRKMKKNAMLQLASMILVIAFAVFIGACEEANPGYIPDPKGTEDDVVDKFPDTPGAGITEITEIEDGEGDTETDELDIEGNDTETDELPLDISDISFTSQPTAHKIALYGSSSTISVAVDDPEVGTLSYLWYKAASSEAEGTLISGANGASLTLTANDADGENWYYAVVKNTGNTTDGIKEKTITGDRTVLYFAQPWESGESWVVDFGDEGISIATAGQTGDYFNFELPDVISAFQSANIKLRGYSGSGTSSSSAISYYFVETGTGIGAAAPASSARLFDRFALGTDADKTSGLTAGVPPNCVTPTAVWIGSTSSSGPGSIRVYSITFNPPVKASDGTDLENWTYGEPWIVDLGGAPWINDLGTQAAPKGNVYALNLPEEISSYTKVTIKYTLYRDSPIKGTANVYGTSTGWFAVDFYSSATTGEGVARPGGANGATGRLFQLARASPTAGLNSSDGTTHTQTVNLSTLPMYVYLGRSNTQAGSASVTAIEVLELKFEP
jgi:hypothetical protein